ncbi:MAG: hypothetical protein ACXVKA_15455 [Acidimicrobiia bacterium]
MSARPGNGFGRPLRPKPERALSPRPWLDPEWWSAIVLEPPSRSEAVAERS